MSSGTFKPIPHNLDAEFDATPSTFHLTQAKLTSDTSQLLLTATLQDYDHPRVQAHYDATLDASQFRKILENPSVPVGFIRASGTVDYQEIANRSLLDTVVVKGDLNSQQLDVQTPDLRSQIRNIAAHYTLENGDATLADFRASLLGGLLTSTGKMSNLSGTPHSKFNASLRGIRLADVNHAMKSSAVPKNIALGGVLNADADAAWGKTFDDIVAHADASMHASVSKSTSQVIPVESAIHGTYTGGNQQLALKQSYLRTPQSTLTMNGTVSQRSSLDLKFQSNNLAELETIADLFTTLQSAAGACRHGALSGHGARIYQRASFDRAVDRLSISKSTEPSGACCEPMWMWIHHSPVCSTPIWNQPLMERSPSTPAPVCTSGPSRKIVPCRSISTPRSWMSRTW